LHGRVELLGGLPHDKVRDVLCRGHIFLNTSLTESFCIAILEAVCCGLLVVTTDVGGIPEVLPPHMAYLGKPEERSILRQLQQAVVKVKTTPCNDFYDTVSDIYSRQVAERTEKVYDYVMDQQVPNIMSRIKSSFSWGPIVGIFALLFTIIEAISLCITEKLFPESGIDIARNFDSNIYNKDRAMYGEHEVYVNPADVRHKTKTAKMVEFTFEQATMLKKEEKEEVQGFDHTLRYLTQRPIEV
jgi:phosphatidylinositol glycan class A protein